MSDEKIKIALDGLLSEGSIAEMCWRERISQGICRSFEAFRKGYLVGKPKEDLTQSDNFRWDLSSRRIN